jgi:hypothetical protein
MPFGAVLTRLTYSRIPPKKPFTYFFPSTWRVAEIKRLSLNFSFRELFLIFQESQIAGWKRVTNSATFVVHYLFQWHPVQN